MIGGLLVSLAWIGMHVITGAEHGHAPFTVCLIKNVTGIPCPSCGITRTVLSLLHGHPVEALQYNLLGYGVAMLLILVPGWIIWDLLWRKESLWRAFLSMEAMLRQPAVAVPLVLFVAINWMWNIYKGL